MPWSNSQRYETEYFFRVEAEIARECVMKIMRILCVGSIPTLLISEQKDSQEEEELMSKRSLSAIYKHVGGLWIAIALAFVVLGASTATLSAQDYRAKLTVTVTDSTGAVIPGATLELTRISTGVMTPAKTDASGAFVFQFLDPDTYSLKAKAASMGQAELTGIILQSYAASSVSVKLKPAAVSAEVTVTSEAAMLETQSASRAFSIPNETVTELPVINGNPVLLGNDIPGVRVRNLGIYTEPWTLTGAFMINGGLMYLNEFQIDGAPNDVEMGNNTYAYTPPQFSTKEFSVSANNYDAEYGHTSGGVVNLSTLSGTDKYHGMVWSSFRRTGWNANSFQNKYENSINGTSSNTVPFNTETQLGFQAGGPIAIPHLLRKSAKYKPYFFFAYDHYTEELPRSLLLSYPTAKMRTGDFSELLNQSTGYPNITINDPDSVHQNANGVWVRDPFPGNVIPQGRLNPVALAVAKLFPTVGSTPRGQRVGQNDLSLPNNYYNWHFHNVLGRFDFNVGDKYKFFLRPVLAKFTEVSNAGGITGPGENGGDFMRASRGFLFDFVDVVNPKTVLNVRAGYMNFAEGWSSPENQGFNLTSLGLPSSFTSVLQQPALFGYWNFTGYNGMGWYYNSEITGTYSLQGSLSHNIGKHNLRMGADLRLIRYNFYSPGAFTFNNGPEWTEDTWINQDGLAVNRSGDGFASFLLGTPTSGNTTLNADEQFSSKYIAPWVQDDWRIAPHLTINLGLRYDVLTGPVERKDRLYVGFDPNIPNAVQQEMPSNAASLLPAASNLTGGLVYAGINGGTRQAIATVYDNIQPRFGFEYQPIDKLVIRGGYGLFYTNIQNNLMMNQLGFTSNTPLVDTNDNGIHPIDNLLNNPFPGGLIQPTGASLGTMTGVGNGLLAYNHNYRLPDANEFSLGVQYRLFRNDVIDASYVGNRVNGYDMNYDANYPTHDFIKTISMAYGDPDAQWGNGSAPVPNPFKGVPAFAGTGYYSSPTMDAYDMNRPHPEFTTVTVCGMNDGHIWYNGLQINYRHRMSHGVSFNSSYVWSKQIEQWGWLSQDLNLRQRSVYAVEIPKSFKLDGVFQLPFGRNRHFNMSNNRVADAIAGGWDLSPIFTLQSGEPIALPSGARPLAHNKFIRHPNWSNRNPNGFLGWGHCVLHHLAGGGVEPLPTNTVYGTCPSDLSQYDWIVYDTLNNEAVENWNSDVIRMKPMLLTDVALQKSFKVHEGKDIILRLQANNALNHFNMLTARFNSNAWDPNFGSIIPGQTSTLDCPPRTVNIQVRFAF